MTVFKTEECVKKPRADMYLPGWLLGLSIFFDAVAVVCLVASITMQKWSLLIGFAIAAAVGVMALLCWKNQGIVIIDDNVFEYSSFLCKKTRYNFSEIKEIRMNQDSLTLFVGEERVHIESCVCISQGLIDKINAVLEKNGGQTENVDWNTV